NLLAGEVPSPSPRAWNTNRRAGRISRLYPCPLFLFARSHTGRFSSRRWKLLLHPPLPPLLVARRRRRALLPVQIKGDRRHHLRSHATGVQDRESRRGRLQPNQLECVI